MTNLSNIVNQFDGYFDQKIFADQGVALGINAITTITNTTYTLLDTDNGKFLVMNNASDITISIGTGLPVGFTCTILQKGAGRVIISGAGATIRTVGSANKTAAQWAMITLFSPSTDEVVVGGNASP